MDLGLGRQVCRTTQVHCAFVNFSVFPALCALYWTDAPCFNPGASCLVNLHSFAANSLLQPQIVIFTCCYFFNTWNEAFNMKNTLNTRDFNFSLTRTHFSNVFFSLIT